MGIGSGCGRTCCAYCDEEMIHRDHRGRYESASALGQIVGRRGPLNLSVTDADLIARKGTPEGLELLRFVEQKNPGHRFDKGQERIMRLIDRCIEHCTLCPDAADLHLHARSGLYIMRGHIAGATTGRRETRFDGPQDVERLRDGAKQRFTTHEELFHFLDPYDDRRRRGMGWKGQAA
jgi:hypothetical protein